MEEKLLQILKETILIKIQGNTIEPDYALTIERIKTFIKTRDLALVKLLRKSINEVDQNTNYENIEQ